MLTEAIMQNLIKAIVLAFLMIFGFAIIWAGLIGYLVIFRSAEFKLANYLANWDLMLYLAGGIFLAFVGLFLFLGRK